MTWWDSITRPLTSGDVWDALPDQEPEYWPPIDGPLDRIPIGHAEMVRVYGDPAVTYSHRGKVRVAKKWEYAQLHTVPAALIPGYDHRIYMHRLVAPYFREAMRRAITVCPDYAFDRIGCFDPRHMRYDRSRPLSLHTWAIAFDVNSDRNPAWHRTSGDPLPFERGWSDRSDLPQPIVEAWESVGFEWGGRWHRFVDPMHFQLAWTSGERRRREQLRTRSALPLPAPGLPASER